MEQQKRKCRYGRNMITWGIVLTMRGAAGSVSLVAALPALAPLAVLAVGAGWSLFLAGHVVVGVVEGLRSGT